jgi:hypothetical protein
MYVTILSTKNVLIHGLKIIKYAHIADVTLWKSLYIHKMEMVMKMVVKMVMKMMIIM